MEGNKKGNGEIMPLYETCVFIEKNIFLGNNKTSLSKATLTKYNINHILLVGNELAPLFKKDYEYMQLKFEDTENENILDSFNSVYEFIERGSTDGNAILINCLKGISRSPTILIAYIMKKYHLKFEDAYQIIKTSKPDIQPNEGFIKKLIAFEKKLKNNSEVDNPNSTKPSLNKNMKPKL